MAMTWSDEVPIYVGQAWKYHDKVLVFGDPPVCPDEWPDDDPRRHNCDAMGCGSVDHVLMRFPKSDDARVVARPPEDAEFVAGLKETYPTLDEMAEELAYRIDESLAARKELEELKRKREPKEYRDRIRELETALATVNKRLAQVNGAVIGAPLNEHVPPTAEAVIAVLGVHWLTGIECDHEAKTDVATCWCGVWRSEPQPSVGAAVQRWIEHVAEQATAHRTLKTATLADLEAATNLPDSAAP